MSCIEGYENYVIFEDGKIINTNTGKEMKPFLNKFGYYVITLSKNNKKKIFTMHRLIALAFITNPDNKPCVDHINRNRGYNRIENLRWATEMENRRNTKCLSKSGLHYISKKIDTKMKQGFYYSFKIKRPELKIRYNNKDLQQVIEYRNKFCAENNVEINDIL